MVHLVCFGVLPKDRIIIDSVFDKREIKFFSGLESHLTREIHLKLPDSFLCSDTDLFIRQGWFKSDSNIPVVFRGVSVEFQTKFTELISKTVRLRELK